MAVVCKLTHARNVVPSWDRRGGCASRKSAKPPFESRRRGGHSGRDHPVRAFFTLFEFATITLFYRNEFLEPRVGWSDLRGVQVSFGVQAHAFDKIQLARLMPLMTD